MLFNSVEFLLFLPLVLVMYWAITGGALRSRIGAGALRVQNLLLLVASYVFYGWWDWRFLGLIAFSTVVDYGVGLQIAKANSQEIPPGADKKARSPKAKRWLFVSILVNLGLLGYFKYANFFIESWVDAWAAAGVTMHASSLRIILPVGISFYTFQTLSYSIDIYRRTMPPTRDPIAFAAFVSFFPQLVAGPIERASHLLPQIERRRTFDPELAASGLKLMVWGMFKKIVVADTCAHYAEAILSGTQHMPAPMMWTGLILFSFQIYGDFSGYSDIAIGTARLFGIRLSTNFKMPYFSRDIAEFWRRWHISLSTWFRDYLYIPLGGSRGGRWQAVRNTFAIFLISGLWHGANWTFVAWGALHALFFLPLLLMGRNRRHVGDGFRLRQIPSILLTFAMATLAWAFFRAESLSQALHFIGQSIGGRMKLPSQVWEVWSAVGWIIGFLLLIETLWISPSVQKKLLRLHGIWWALGLNALTWVIAVHLRDNPPSFIYFQF